MAVQYSFAHRPGRPGCAVIARVGRGIHCGGRHSVRHDVVGVPVCAVRVVGHQNLRSYLADDLDGRSHGGRQNDLVRVGPPESARVAIRRSVHHSAVAKPPRTAQEAVIRDAEMAHRRSELADPVATELVGLVTGQLEERRHQDFAFLAQGRGQQRDADAVRRVVRHRRAGRDHLVVRMGMHQQQARRDGTTLRTLRDLDRLGGGGSPRPGRTRCRPAPREVAGDEVAVALDLQHRDHGAAAFLLVVGQLLAVLRAPRVEHAPGGRVDRARQVTGEQDALARALSLSRIRHRHGGHQRVGVRVHRRRRRGRRGR